MPEAAGPLPSRPRRPPDDPARDTSTAAAGRLRAMSLHDETIPTFLRTLTALEGWLTEAEAWAEERGFEPAVLLAARLFPDQFDLTRNIQSACDTAKLTGARIAQIEAPRHEDGPSTLAELRTRISEVKQWIAALDPAAFEGRDDAWLSPAFLRGGRIRVAEYVRAFALPNFFFHAVTTYSILRSQGVKLGKIQFIGSLEVDFPKAE
jgi:hypothetical protein